MTASNTSTDNKTYQQILKELYPWKTDESAKLKNSPISTELAEFVNQLTTQELNANFTQHVDKQLEQSPYLKLRNRYPTLVDIAKFLDRVFRIALSDKNTKAPLSSVINKLKPAVYKIAIFDYRLFANPNHAGNLYLNKLAQLNTSLSLDSPLIDEIEPMVTRFTDKISNCTDLEKIRETVESSYQKLNGFISSIEKKALIFEKRNQEIAEGKSRASQAKQWVDDQTKTITATATLPMFVTTFIEQSWKHVLFLERLRNNNTENIESIIILKYLMLCFKPVADIVELEKLSTLHEHVSQALEEHLDKTNLSTNEASAFMRGLNLSFGAVVKQSEEAIHENNKDQIIRLKPKSHLAMSLEEPEDEKPDIESMSALEWAEYQLSQQEELYPDRENEAPSVEERPIPESISDWTTGDWFDIKTQDKTTRAKLVSHVESTGLFIFANYQGAKVLECHQQELQEKLQHNKITKIKLRPNFELALEETFVKTHTEQLEKQVAERRRKEKKRLEQLEAERKAKQALEEKARQEEKRRQQVNEAKEQINTLSVGSWIEITQNNKIKKCKLAARISSTDKFIFTDRNGVKIIEPSLEELANLLVDERISLTLKNDLFNQTLASVISERRKSN